MFGEVSEPLSAEMNEIWLIKQTSKIALALVYSHYYRKLLIFQFPLIITYPVSYEVDKAYKVIHFDNTTIRQNENDRRVTGWLKLQDRTMTDKLAGPDIAGQTSKACILSELSK